MGKISKSSASEEPDVAVITTIKNKRRKKTEKCDSVIVSSKEKERKTTKPANEPVDINEELNSVPVVATKKVKKVKKSEDTHEQSSDNFEINPTDEILLDGPSKAKAAVKIKKVKKSEAVQKPRSKEKNKKIIFVDDQPQEIPANNGSANNSLSITKKTFLNDDEAEVNDEDIDKFCDELDDEDNVQYENWVKLIEAKLHSNKKLK